MNHQPTHTPNEAFESNQQRRYGINSDVSDTASSRIDAMKKLDGISWPNRPQFPKPQDTFCPDAGDNPKRLPGN
jgi:hypothetical protein